MSSSGRGRLALFGAIAAVALAGCGDALCEDPVSVPVPTGTDIVAQLQALPNVVSVTEQTSRYTSHRLFIIEFDQPVDYCAPKERRFTQTATLLFNGDHAAPMVFRTAGYGISRNPYVTEPVALLPSANQLTLEHRFFGPSTPNPVDWKALTVEQAAGDHHRVIQSLKRIFPGKWITTGASKDGMTAVFHRYFYPDDVDGTVAYVAPLMFSRADERFPPFVDSLGDPSCRDALKTYQRTLLQRRSEIEPEFASYAAANFTSLDIFGVSKTLDYSTLESRFGFWMFGSASMCASIPPPAAPPADLFQFLVDIGAAQSMTDANLTSDQAYYYQSATQLGSTLDSQDHLLDLTGGVPIDDLIELYPPYGVAKDYDPSLMEKVDAWMKDSASRVLLVYGSADPWSAAAMTVSATNESYRFFVQGGNHYSRIQPLDPASRQAAYDAMAKWAGEAGMVVNARGAPAMPSREAQREELLGR